MGKGSKARPYSIPKEEFDSNWERIFGNKEKKEVDKPQEVDDNTNNISVV